MAVTKYMIDQGWHNEKFIQENVNYFEDFNSLLEKYTLEYAEQITGISAATLIQIAEMIRDADGTCVLWGMGVTQNTGGSDTSAAISNLLLATGNYRRPGAGAYPPEATITCKAHAIWGTLPAWLPGYQHVTDSVAREKFEKAYGVKIKDKPGLDNIQMLHSIDEGKMKAMYLVGEDMALVDSNANHVHEILSNLDFLLSKTFSFQERLNMLMLYSLLFLLLKKTERLPIRSDAYKDCIKHCQRLVIRSRIGGLFKRLQTA